MSSDRTFAAQRRYERLYAESATPPVPLRRKDPTIEQHSETIRAFFQDEWRGEEPVPGMIRQTPSPYRVRERFAGDPVGADSTMHGIIPAEFGSFSRRTPTPERGNWAFALGEPFHRVTRLPSSTGTPSTFYSDSPIPWSSRGTTPTSMSSYSPGITQAMSFGPGQKGASPFRGRTPNYNNSDTDSPLHTTRHVASKELQTSGPETTSDQPTERRRLQSPVEVVTKRKKSRERLAQRRVSPPPRKSSTKFKSPKRKDSAETSDNPDLRESNVEPKSSGKEQNPITPAVKSPGPPSRPSRKGTTALDIQTSPVVQSDLPAGALKSHRSKQAGNNAGRQLPSHMAPTVSSANKSQPAMAQRVPTTRSNSTPAVPHSGLEGRNQNRSRDRSMKTPSPNPQTATAKPIESVAKSGKLSRLGIFGRRPKTPKDDSDVQPRKPRTLRKGPAAGTGHEGYGKYSQRGRRPSMGSHSNSRDRSVSSAGRSDSSWKSSNPSGSESEMDDFVSQRLDPIIIPGGGGLSAHPSQQQEEMNSQVGAQLSGREPILKDTAPQETDSLASTTSLEQPSDAMGPTEQYVYRSSPERGRAPTLAVRRSLSRLHKHGDLSGAQHLPSPIRTTAAEMAHTLDALDSAQSPVPRSDSTAPPMSISSAEGQRKTKGSRWNLFSRKRRERSVSPDPQRHEIQGNMPVAVAHIPDHRPVPFYALLDSEYEQEQGGTRNDPEALGEIFDAIEDSPPSENPDPDSAPAGLGLHTQHGHSILLPSPPSFMSQFGPGPYEPAFDAGQPVRGADNHQEQSNTLGDTRSPRLAQVGRIPAVVAMRGREHLPSRQSYSRPFAATAVARSGDSVASGSTEEIRPILGVRTDPLPSRPFGDPYSGHPASAPATNEKLVKGRPKMTQAEFLAYSSWYDSVQSSSSSSNMQGTPNFTQHGRPLTMGRQLGEDEIWREYDDLLDEVLSPAEPAEPHHAEDPRLHPESYLDIMPASAVVPLAYEPPQVPINPLATSTLTVPELRNALSTESIRLRRSLIAPVLHSSMSASSPSSLAELVAEYEERNRHSTILLDRMSYLFEEAEEDTDPYRTTAYNPQTAISTTEDHRRNTILLDIAERDREGPVGLSNLRYGALMISRWLSFSRVLFSPVHNKLSTTPNERILVLDGLGNDDWSYYCAETYPTANVHSLNSMVQPSAISTESTPEAWPAPPNHHAVRINPATQTFPFPQSFFAAVVFRFPAAMPENALKRTLGECYRVLQPGGYLEMSVMDLDMINMGNRTRRAVRMLKVRMNVADPGISLKPASDNIQKIIGRRGFQNLNKCIVSIPVAGVVASSSMDSSSSRLSQSSTRPSETASAPYGPSTSSDRPARASTTESSSASERNILLSDLIADRSDKSDQRITKMVAKVGRWWYTRCYEWAVLPDGDLERSIWTDKKVLRECEHRGSGFKLLIAYAQKPMDARRRTLSEPSPPTGAISSGMSRMRLHESA